MFLGIKSNCSSPARAHSAKATLLAHYLLEARAKTKLLYYTKCAHILRDPIDCCSGYWSIPVS